MLVKSFPAALNAAQSSRRRGLGQPQRPSTVTLTGAPTRRLPAGSVAAGVKLCRPSPSTTVAMHVQVPSTAVGAPQMVRPLLSVTVTVERGSAAPANVGVSSPIVEPFAGRVMVGAGGGTESMVNLTGSPMAAFPAGSVATGLAVTGPCGRTGDRHDHVPSGAVLALQMGVCAPFRIAAVEPGSAWPAKVTGFWFTVAPWRGSVMSGFAGETVSTVTFVGRPVATLPA